MLKLAFGRHRVQTADDAMTFLAGQGVAFRDDAFRDDAFRDDAFRDGGADRTRRWLRDYLDSPRSTIGGGTEQIQRRGLPSSIRQLVNRPGVISASLSVWVKSQFTTESYAG